MSFQIIDVEWWHQIRTGKFKENPAPLKYSLARYETHSPAFQILAFQLEGMTLSFLSFKKAGVYILGKICIHLSFFIKIFRYGHQRIWKTWEADPNWAKPSFFRSSNRQFFKVWFNGPYVQWGSDWWICFCWSEERWSQEETKWEVIHLTLTLVVPFDVYTLGWL